MTFVSMDTKTLMMYHFRRRCGLRQMVFLVSVCALILTYKAYSNHYWMHHVLDVIIVEEHHEVRSE